MPTVKKCPRVVLGGVLRVLRVLVGSLTCLDGVIKMKYSIAIGIPSDPDEAQTDEHVSARCQSRNAPSKNAKKGSITCHTLSTHVRW